MAASDRKTLILGAEYDDNLRGVLRNVLKRLGAKGLAHDWGVAGSQELETVEVLVGVDTVIIEAETFVGLSISGPVEIVERIQAMVAAAVKQT